MRNTMVVLVVSVVALSGCAGNLSVAHESATLSGSPEGLRAMFDGMNGLISGGKASADKKTAFTVMREGQEKELTKRAMAPSFLASIFARTSASNVTNVDMSEGNEIEDIK